ncbi:hypothetical protein [Halomonas urumqiensis]|uniref:hypothetical protein n=1 Tax=Halomonas urumqiensis TaxID=1684789 RepID=UPI0011AF0A3B|nr:hypothetical protein [Halomonas urumqiensis]GHE22825.1 hypothetical protein GCM10017767_33460 [Halomonas urumqiensis]
MNKKLTLVAMFCAVLLFAFNYSHAQGFAYDIDELASKDKLISESASELCNDIGKKDCDTIKTHCIDTPMPNSCFQRYFLFHAMDVINCEGEKLNQCSLKRAEYQDKVSDFANKYANKPGYGRAALNICEPFYNIDTNNEWLKEIKGNLDLVMEGLGQYRDFEGYYNCIQEQYIKFFTDGVKKGNE